jgi:hypothetical protein
LGHEWLISSSASTGTSFDADFGDDDCLFVVVVEEED